MQPPSLKTPGMLLQTGLLNNQQMAAHNATFHWRGSLGGTEVCIAGEFNAWAVSQFSPAARLLFRDRGLASAG